MKKNLILLLLYLITAGNLLAQSPLVDPQIPNGETIRYSTVKGKGDIQYSSQSIYRIMENDVEYYLIKSHSLDQSSESRIQIDQYMPISVNKLTHNSRADFKTSTELLSVPQLNENEIVALDLADLAHILRAYPFNNPRDMQLLFLGQGSEENESMTFKILFSKEEVITIQSKEYDSYKLEFKPELSGAMALFSAMIPKNYFWFSRESPHYLLKFEGSEGPGANNKIKMEIISYTK